MNANVSPAVPLDTELQQAIAEHQAGRYLEAEEIYLSILQAHPYHAIANHNLGLLAGQVGQHEAGLPYLRKALSIDPDEGQFWLSYANGLLQAGQPDEALDIVDTAIGRGLDNDASQILRRQVQEAISLAALSPSQQEIDHIVTLYHNGDFAQMETACRQLLEKFPESPFGWSVLGTALQVQGKDALAVLCKTVELTPHDAQAHGNLGNAWQDIGKISEAIDSYLRALEIEPEFAEAHSNLGSALQAQGRHQEASASYRRALAIRPDYVKAHFNLANTLKVQGQLAMAADSYRRVLALMPNDTEAHNQLGEIAHALGNFDEAADSFKAHLQLAPLDAKAHARLGAALQGAGELESAVASYRRAAELAPMLDMLHHNMALALHSLKQYDAAVSAYHLALAATPHCAPLHTRLGDAYRVLDQADAAVPCYRQALQLDPKNGSIMLSLAIALEKTRQIEESLVCYRDATILSPGDINTHISLGMCLRNLGQTEEALACYRQALQIDPESIICLNNVGMMLLDLQRVQEALEQQRLAVALDPDSDVSHCNHGACLQALGQFDEAEASYRQSLALNPDYLIAHSNLCTTLQHLGRHREALEVCRRIQELGEDNAPLHFNIANSLQALRQTDAAKTHFLAALDRDPEYAEAHVNLGTLLQLQGQGEQGMLHMRKALQAKDGHYALAHSNLLFSLSHSATADANTLFAEHCHFGDLLEASLGSSGHSRPFPNSRQSGRRLLIGLVSGDFNNHAVASFLAPVLAQLAGNPNLALYAYYNKTSEDASTQTLRSYMDHWRNVASLSDDAMEELIRTDAIDILIDLSGHSAANRLPVFARKPAPIQASWMGYPGTTGLSAMDYFLSDNKILPAGQFDHLFLEKIVHLPIAAPFIPYSDAPDIGPLPALANGHVTFGSFSRANKLNRKVIGLWSQVLRALPDSVMLMAGLDGDERDNYLRDWFAEEGISNRRLRFHARSSMLDYMQLHQQVDFCLNTFPYTGTTTLCHALWMGVPTLSCSGNTLPTRAAAAYLGHVGLDAFAARDEADFVNKGIFLSQNISALAHLRSTMRERFLQSPVAQPALVSEGLERALRTMWHRWCEQLPPIAFDATHHVHQQATSRESMQ